MFQKYSFCLKLRKMSKDKINKYGNEAAKIFELKELLHRKLQELSVKKDKKLIWEE